MKLNIALLAGDGIGPEVIDQAVKVSDAIAKKFNHEINWSPALTGAAAIDAVGEPYPDETHEICVNSDAVLFGAIVCVGEQRSRENDQDLIEIRGTINIVNEKEFLFKGIIVTKIDFINNGEECIREGEFTFKISGKRKYWRMQEMGNPCEDVVDYIDIYFKKE